MTGSDGALWFADQGDANNDGSVGRIATDGTVTKFTDPGILYTLDVALGPDGAVWFTGNAPDFSNVVGRITPAGKIAIYPAANAVRITAGPDGAMWFTASHSIGRIAMDGTITTFLDSSTALVHDIVTGPDGARWFTDPGSYPHHSIGRMTTAGTLTGKFNGAGITNPDAMTAGPDGHSGSPTPTTRSGASRWPAR